VGAAALVATSGDAPTILINDREEADGTFVLGGPGMYDVTGLFAGGLGKITYTAAKADVDQDDEPDTVAMAKYEASIEEGTSTLTITWKAAMAALLHADVFTIDVSATDEAKTTVTTQVMAQRNAAPMAVDTPIPMLRIGTQDATRPTDNGDAWPATPYTCEKLNACKLTFGEDYITDEDQGGLMYSAVSESSAVHLSPVDGGIMIFGMTPTTADDGMNGDAQQITVTVTAMDLGELSVERTFKVNVDGPPTDGKFPLPAQTITEETMIALAPYISDPEGRNLAYTVEFDETNPYITAEEKDGILTLGVAVNGISGGPVAVKITATEPADGESGVGQTHEITVMVSSE
jgi:hypothetical protein